MRKKLLNIYDMELEKIKNIIKENNHKLPLSYTDVIIRPNKNSTNTFKNTCLKLYSDSNFIMLKFYKPITRF
ncbi:MAG: hypothetical protein CFE24_09705 [Flavobacterium sp. BFFFF2]|nr:MAG: hypothetical protein CFE24_09705 [Flavobacterium sp. BFFFF2]